MTRQVEKIVPISNILFSVQEVTGRLNSFFTDSVILRMDYVIEAIGNDLEGLLEYSTTDLSSLPFEKICVNPGMPNKIRKQMKKGYFVNVPANLLTKNGDVLRVAVSGFYLGLISEINGFIILKVKLLEDNSVLKKELFTKKRELDSFIYRTAHDLRGPLATIKGLVNLLKIRQHNDEVDELTALIDVHANKLDDRLFKLLYLADTNGGSDDCSGCINFDALQARLQRILNDNFQLDKASFLFTTPVKKLCGVNENVFYQLISNIFLYIISLPVASITISIHIEFKVQNDWLNVIIRSDGFLTSGQIREAIHQPTSLYNDLLSYPFLFNYYVAQKEVMQLHALFRIDFYGESEQVLQVSIPLNLSMDSPGQSAEPSPVPLTSID
jgi:signal transduction histidine kinase